MTAAQPYLLPVAILLLSAVLIIELGRWAKKQRARHLQHMVETRRVTLEQVVPFKIGGCRTCGGKGSVKRDVPGYAPRMPMPCEYCAARRFLEKHGKDTTMVGPFRIWKRGRGPANGSRPAARPAAGGAAA